jgi:ribokinase
MNIDYVYTVDHLLQAGETYPSIERNIYCGGKGLNQSIALSRAGAQTYHAGCIGRDDGAKLTSVLQNSGVNTEFVETVDAPSGHTIIQVDSKGQNCILLFGGANQRITERQVDTTLEHFTEDDFIVLQNETNLVPYIAARAADKGMRIVFNPSPANSAIHDVLKNKIDYLILNEIEAQVISNEEDYDKQLDVLQKRFPETAIVLTLGKHGVVYKDKHNTYSHGIYNVKVVDTTAAGDTFTGFFVSAIAQKNDVPSALRLASIASSIAVSKSGAEPSIPTLSEVNDANF